MIACIDQGKAADLILNAGDYFGEIALMKMKINAICREDMFDFIVKILTIYGKFKSLMDRNVGLRVLASVIYYIYDSRNI